MILSCTFSAGPTFRWWKHWIRGNQEQIDIDSDADNANVASSSNVASEYENSHTVHTNGTIEPISSQQPMADGDKASTSAANVSICTNASSPNAIRYIEGIYFCRKTKLILKKSIYCIIKFNQTGLINQKCRQASYIVRSHCLLWIFHIFAWMVILCQFIGSHFVGLCYTVDTCSIDQGPRQMFTLYDVDDGTGIVVVKYFNNRYHETGNYIKQNMSILLREHSVAPFFCTI